MVSENLFKGPLKSHGIFNFLVTGNHVVYYQLCPDPCDTSNGSPTDQREGLWTVEHIVGSPKLPSLNRADEIVHGKSRIFTVIHRFDHSSTQPTETVFSQKNAKKLNEPNQPLK